MTRKTQQKLRRLYPYIGVVIIGLLIVLGVFLFAKKPEEVRPTIVVSTTTTTAPLIIETTTEPVETTEEDSLVPAIDAVNVDKLIEKYYAAKLANDADALNNIVECETPYTVADLADETQFISKYEDFTTYVLPGIKDNYFIVYVKYNIFFNGIDTGAPALNHFICVKDEDDCYYIYDKSISGEFQTYLEETEKSETVLRLKEQVETELEAACAGDTDLLYLMQLLNGESN